MRLLFLIASLLASNLYAQTFESIRGKLVDRKTKQPIPYASVYVKGRSIGTTTNDEGRFLFHVPSTFANDTLVISFIGYNAFKSVVRAMADQEPLIELTPSVTKLQEITVVASRTNMTAKEVVKMAVKKIPDNYPMTPFTIEGFFRDLQKENGKPVELLEAALRFKYTDYNPGFEDVEIIEVRRSYNQRHPVNGTYDRQNSIVDLMEDNYVKHRFGPLQVKGWKYTIDSVFAYNEQFVYQISGTRAPGETTMMYINGDDYSILKVEYAKQMVNGEFYRRYLNLPDPYGLQETSFRVVFEFQKLDNKMYLKYQKEEDTYNLFNKTTNDILLKQSFVKELFVNNVMKSEAEKAGSLMNINKSVEGQSQSYNAEFWKYYNAPIATAKESAVIKELEESALKPENNR